MNVNAYVDGFNLYYRALRGTNHKWLDLRSLSSALLDPGDSLNALRYFTARVSARAVDPDVPKRQQLYLSALEAHPQTHVHYGRFLSNPKWRPIAHPTWNPHVCVQVLNTEEKGSDVSLATHLLNDAWHNRFDVCLVFTQDTDLLETLRIVKEERGKTVGLVWLDGRNPSNKFIRASSFVRHLTPARLAAAQFPEVVPLEGGKSTTKPQGW